MRRTLTLAACLAASACSTSRTTGDTARAAEVACAPAKLGLGDAKPLARWAPPAGCTWKVDSTQFLRTPEELTTSLECTGAAPGVDLTQQTLVVTSRTLSPAEVGVDAVDDGKTLTFVTRQRPPCEGDPHPMPVPMTLSFSLPAGAKREVKESTCMLPKSCP